MLSEDVERVHGVLWGWSALRLQEHPGSTSYRQDLARTMYRLAFTEAHAAELLRLGLAEQDAEVVVTLMWGFYHVLETLGKHQCMRAVPGIGLDKALQHPSSMRRVLACDILVRMVEKGYVADAQLRETFDALVVGILQYPPWARVETVDVAVRYFLLRPRSTLPPLKSLLPCGGLAWRKAMELLATRGDTIARPDFDFRLAVPLSSDYSVQHMVSIWSTDVQRFFIELYAKSDVTGLDGSALVAAFDALAHCVKARGDMHLAVPGVVGTLESLGYGESHEDRLHVWDAGWHFLEMVPAEDLGAYVPRLLGLVERVPEVGMLSWSKDRIQSVLASVYPNDAVCGMDLLATPSTLEVLPDAMVQGEMDAIVATLASRSCYVYHGHRPYGMDLGCLRLICRMSAAHRAKHLSFVLDHAPVLLECIATCQPDPRLRLGARNLLGRLPDELFEPCVGTLAEIVEEGDVAGMLSMSSLSPSRLRILRRPILQRVFELADFYTSDLRPSAALALLGRLPDDILVMVIDGIVDAAVDQPLVIQDMHLPMPKLEDRLFVLNMLPVDLITPRHAEAIAAQCFHGNCGVMATQLAMEMMVRGSHRDVCNRYSDWIAKRLVEGPTRAARYEAHKMLLLLEPPFLTATLEAIDLHRLFPRHACLILSKLKTDQLECFADDVLVLAEDYMYLDATMHVLARLPSSAVWERRERILDLIERRKGPRWDGSRQLLSMLAQAGVADASSLLQETRFKDVLC